MRHFHRLGLRSLDLHLVRKVGRTDRPCNQRPGPREREREREREEGGVCRLLLCRLRMGTETATHHLAQKLVVVDIDDLIRGHLIEKGNKAKAAREAGLLVVDDHGLLHLEKGRVGEKLQNLSVARQE